MCADYTRAFLDKTLPAGHINRKLNFYLFYSANYIKFTLVEHSVGRHLDIFAEDRPSLENRVCFAYKSVGRGATGRGGAGPQFYCYALLDWGAPARNRRRVWTHPQNQNFPGAAAQHYGENNRIARLDQHICRVHIANAANPGFWMPEGVTVADLNRNYI